MDLSDLRISYTKDSFSESDLLESPFDQFEKWWDKYHISLTQIDSEINESEKLVHGFLKELGYE